MDSFSQPQSDNIHVSFQPQQQLTVQVQTYLRIVPRNFPGWRLLILMQVDLGQVVFYFAIG